MAELFSIVYQPKDQEYDQDAIDYMRLPLAAAELVTDYGIAGDRKGGHPSRQLNLLSLEWLEARRREGYRTGPGQFGEQLIVKGLDVLSLNPGDRVQLGDEAVVEITKPRTGCLRLAAAQRQAEELDVGSIGMMARVVDGGTIRVGDSAKVLQPSGATG
jgi:MOSC domain-containing protein YiiM